MAPSIEERDLHMEIPHDLGRYFEPADQDGFHQYHEIKEDYVATLNGFNILVLGIPKADETAPTIHCEEYGTVQSTMKYIVTEMHIERVEVTRTRVY